MFGIGEYHRSDLARISLGSVPHADAVRGIEPLGSKVLPAVRAAVG